MPTWGEILREVNDLTRSMKEKPPAPGSPSPQDIVRKKYVGELATFTGRPAIVYASGWMAGHPVPDPGLVSVHTQDVLGFMEAINGLPVGPLDLMLHSPGGDANAAQAIMHYLRAQGFGPIRAMVPLCAMSAATMMALSCDEILMGNHSQLGPIDPQFTIQTPDGPRGAPAQAILDQFDQAKRECAADPQSLAAWLPILRSYGPGLLSQCVTSQKAAEDLVCAALTKHMFSGEEAAEAEAKAKRIAAWFNDHKTHASHGRPVRIEDALAQELNVTALEADDSLQDKVLSAWHGVQLSLWQRPILKMVESSNGKSWLLSGQAVVVPNAQVVKKGPVTARRAEPVPQEPINRQQRRQAERQEQKRKS